jgi:hypothetical protein
MRLVKRPKRGGGIERGKTFIANTKWLGKQMDANPLKIIFYPSIL